MRLGLGILALCLAACSATWGLTSGQVRVARLLDQGGRHSADGNWRVARRSFVSALEGAARIDYLDGRLTALIELGRLHFELEDLEGARGYYIDALAQAAAVNHLSAQSRALAGLASLASAEGHHAEAREELLDALELARRTEKEALISRRLSDLGVVERFMGRRAEARKRYEEAIELADDAGSKFAEALARANLAMLLVDEKQYKAARRELRFASKVYKEADSSQAVAGLLERQAKLESAAGNHDEAFDLRDRAVLAWRALRRWNDALRVFQASIDDLRARGLREEAERRRKALAGLQRRARVLRQMVQEVRGVELGNRTAREVLPEVEASEGAR